MNSDTGDSTPSGSNPMHDRTNPLAAIAASWEEYENRRLATLAEDGPPRQRSSLRRIRLKADAVLGLCPMDHRRVGRVTITILDAGPVASCNQCDASSESILSEIAAGFLDLRSNVPDAEDQDSPVDAEPNEDLEGAGRTLQTTDYSESYGSLDPAYWLDRMLLTCAAKQDWAEAARLSRRHANRDAELFEVAASLALRTSPDEVVRHRDEIFGFCPFQEHATVRVCRWNGRLSATCSDENCGASSDAILTAIRQGLEIGRLVDLLADPKADPFLGTCNPGHDDPGEEVDPSPTGGGDPADDDPPDAAESSGRWPIKAVGRRPIDHAVRDATVGAIHRHRASHEFRRMVQKPPEWMVESAAGLHGPARTIAYGHLALRHGRDRMLRRVASRLDARLVLRLADCVPHGVLVGKDPGEMPCGMPHICPWCHGRWAVEHYRRLQSGPCRPAGSNTLLLGRITLPDRGLLYVEPGATGRVLASPTLGHLSGARVKAVLGHWGPLLKWWARRCGAVGGITIHRVGPGLDQAGDPCHEHTLSILAEVPAQPGDDPAWANLVANSKVGWGASEPTIPIFGHCLSEADKAMRPLERQVYLEAAVATPGGPDPLRSLWFGVSRGSDLERLGIAINGGMDRRQGWGFDGAAALPNWLIELPGATLDRIAATKGAPLWSPWGTWASRGAIPKLPRKRPSRNELDTREILRQRGNAKRHRKAEEKRCRMSGLALLNSSRAAIASDRVDRLLALVSIPYRDQHTATGRRPGRPWLRALLGDLGEECSDNLAKKILARLNPTSDPAR